MKSLIPTLLLLTFAISAHSQSIEEKYRAATGFLQAGQHEEAVEAFTAVLSSTEEAQIQKFAYIFRSQSYAGMGQYESAISDINKAIEIDPYDLASYFDRIHVYQAMNNYEAMLKDAEHILQQKPQADQKSNAHYYKGTAYLNTGEFKEAIKSFKIAKKHLDDDPELNLYMGKAYEMTGDFKTAIEYYTEVIELSPDWYAGHYSRGNARLLKFRAENNDVVISVMVRDACDDLKKSRELGFKPVEVIDQMIEMYCN